MRILLASKSPRRRQLISSLDWPVRVVDVDCDESQCGACRAEQRAERIALLKAQAYDASTLAADEVLVTADTVVAFPSETGKNAALKAFPSETENNYGEVMGKPHNEAEAVSMLQRLSGRWHHVYTGVALTWRGGQTSFTEDTRVCFRRLATDEILYYIRRYKPYDKAGSYGVQEWIGMVGIERIEGCYYNVMGLPLARLYAEICKLPVAGS